MRKIIPLTALLALALFTGCEEKTLSPDPIPETTASAAAASKRPSVTTIAPTSTTAENAAYADRIASVLAQIYPGDEEDEALLDMMMTKASHLSLPPADPITTEEAATQRAKEVLTAAGLTDWIESAESEYVELDGERVRYTRSNPPYTVQYFAAEEIWYVQPNAPCGITEDGRNIAAPSMPPYVLLNQKNGDVLAIF